VLLSVSQLLLHSVVAAFQAAAAETPQLTDNWLRFGCRISCLKWNRKKNNESNRIPIFPIESLRKIVESFPKNAQIAILIPVAIWICPTLLVSMFYIFVSYDGSS